MLNLVVGYKRGALALAMMGSSKLQEFRDKLEDDGVIFQTELDTEVIANLIARNHKNDIEDAIVRTLNDIKGPMDLL